MTDKWLGQGGLLAELPETPARLVTVTLQGCLLQNRPSVASQSWEGAWDPELTAAMPEGHPGCVSVNGLAVWSGICGEVLSLPYLTGH